MNLQKINTSRSVAFYPLTACIQCGVDGQELFKLDHHEDFLYCEKCADKEYKEMLIDFLRLDGSREIPEGGICCDCQKISIPLWDTSHSGNFLTCAYHGIARIIAVELFEQIGLS